MIFKGKHRRTASFRQLLNYLLDDKGRGIQEGYEVIRHNVPGDTVDEWVKHLEMNEFMGQRLRKNRIRVLHEIISFHDNDKEVVTPEVLRSMAKEYIQRRNPIGMFVIIPHTSDDHIHIHVCGSPWEQFGGKSLRLSKQNLSTLKLHLERYQIEHFPQLAYSKGQHDSKIMPERTSVERGRNLL